MKRSSFTEEQIAHVLRQAESGVPVQDLIRKTGITEPGALWAYFTVGRESLAVWAWLNCADFVSLNMSDALHDGRRFRVFTIVDHFSRVSPALEVDVSLTGKRVAQVLERLKWAHGLSSVIHSDNGSEFMKHFDQELRRLHNTHWHTYPRTPKMTPMSNVLTGLFRRSSLITIRSC